MTTEKHAATTLEMLIALRRQHEATPKIYRGQELPSLTVAYFNMLEPLVQNSIMTLLDSDDPQKQEFALECAKVWLTIQKEGVKPEVSYIFQSNLENYVATLVKKAPRAVAETTAGQDICIMAVDSVSSTSMYGSRQAYKLYWVERNNIPLEGRRMRKLVDYAYSEIYKTCRNLLADIGENIPDQNQNLSNLLDPKAVRKVMKDKERVAEYRKEVSKHNSEKLQEYTRMYRRLQELDVQR